MPRELLWDRWRSRAEAAPDADAVVHWRAGDAPVRWRRSELVSAAAGAARGLRECGIRRGDVCALILRHHPYFSPLYLGVSAAGAIPAVLAYPNPRLHRDKFTSGLAGMARRSGLDFVLTERALEPAVRPLVEGAGSSVRGVLFPLEHEWPPLDPGAVVLDGREEEPCLLQHSSGTTGLQKAVVLSHRAVLDHVGRYAEAIALDRDRDRIVSWLPLYHDMGLIAAFHMPLALGVPTVQLDPFEWVQEPELLLQAVSEERGTLAWLPNFAYRFLADRAREELLDGVRLDSLRLLVNCSEPVRAGSHERFLERFAKGGLAAHALGACYAMAETTFAATQTAPGARARELAVDRDELARGLVVPAAPERPARLCVSSGRPISGCELRIVDEERRAAGAGRVGEIAIRSSTAFDGYRNLPEETSRVRVDGWYFSGDLGFEWDGEYYVVGRKKDLIIVAGNNLYPEDIEDEVAQVPGVLPGRAVAFGVEDEGSGTEQVWVVAETDVPEGPGRKALAMRIVQAGMSVNVTISHVHLAPPRWLIKSSSGKPSRGANRARVLAGALPRTI